jgi:molybdenum cofactor cytidylyltransferase
VVVVGSNAAAIAESLGDRDLRIIRNPNPMTGMVSSIRIGVAALPDSLDRFLIALGDQPRVRAEDVSRLIRQHIESGRGIALPVYRGKRGHPILFSSTCRREILDLIDGQTLRDVIIAHQGDCLEVDCDSDAYVCDIDTVEEYEHELRRSLDEQ